MSRLASILGAAAALALASPALAQHGHEAPSAEGRTVNLQGNEAVDWHNDPQMHRFYDLTRATLAKGADGIDFAAYQAKSYDIFRVFAGSHGMPPEAMVDHLKAIPGQMVQIAKEDPKVLDSYENFRDALFGPP